MSYAAKQAMLGISALLGFPLLIALLATWRGYILSVLWAWFLVPLGVPLITIPLAIGFSLIVGFLTFNNTKKEPPGTLFNGLIMPPVFLGVGWLVKLFV